MAERLSHSGLSRGEGAKSAIPAVSSLSWSLCQTDVGCQARSAKEDNSDPL